MALVPQALRIVRKSSFTRKPWKNGGGVTYEALRVPADGDTFEWRVSVAHIDTSGPFSDFAAYNRTTVLLKGDGVDLEFADGGRHSLRRVGDLAEFDGALATYCTLLGGPCVDLNLMVAKSHAAQGWVQDLTATQGSFNASASCAESTLIFSLNAPIAVQAAGAQPKLLEPWDLGIISDCSAQVTRQELGASSKPSAVFFATISH